MHALTSFDWKIFYSLLDYSNNAMQKMNIVHFFLFTLKHVVMKMRNKYSFWR